MFLKIVKYYIGYIKELQDSKASFSRIIKIMSYDSLEKGNANVETLEKLSLKNLTFSYLVKGTENVIINKFTCDFYKGKKYVHITANIFTLFQTKRYKYWHSFITLCYYFRDILLSLHGNYVRIERMSPNNTSVLLIYTGALSA